MSTLTARMTALAEGNTVGTEEMLDRVGEGQSDDHDLTELPDLQVKPSLG